MKNASAAAGAAARSADGVGATRRRSGSRSCRRRRGYYATKDAADTTSSRCLR